MTDVDWFKITLTKGTSYTAELNIIDEDISDYDLDLLAANGSLIKRASGIDLINGPLPLTYTASTNGTYFLRIIYYDYTSANYQVSLRAN